MPTETKFQDYSTDFAIAGYSTAYVYIYTGSGNSQETLRVYDQRGKTYLIDSNGSGKASAEDYDCQRGLAGAALEAVVAAESRRRCIAALASEVEFALQNPAESPSSAALAALRVLAALAK